jgi:5-hydroxyisourate hydrolase-like protein (transthyretin family)
MLLAVIMLMSAFSITAFAGDPLDENGDTGGTGPGGGGSLADYWTGAWYGMRITVIDVTDTGDILNGTVRGKVAAGTVSADITNLSASDSFFTRTVAGDGSTPLTYGNKVVHYGKASKMAYRDGEALSSTTADYQYYTVSGLPVLMGSGQASAQEIKDFINNRSMLTQIAQWCGVSSYDELVSGKYKLLCEPILYSLAGTIKYAFTATEGAMVKPHGEEKWSLINNTLANAFYLEYDELGWYAWTGATDVKQTFPDIIEHLGMHIYSIAPDYILEPDPKSVKIIKKSDTGGSLSGARFTVVGGDKNQTVTVNGTLTIDLTDLENGTYTVTETVAPSGYELSAAPQTFTITDDGVSPAKLTFINTFVPPPPVEALFKKVEYGTEKGLSGAVFKVTQLSHWERHLIDPNGDDAGEFYDDDNGDALNSGEPGYHHNVEDLADDEWQWLEIRETEIAGTFVSGADGSIPVGELEAGSYAIEEISPPAGYALAETIGERLQTFDIPREGGYAVSIVFTNKKLPGLTVLKVDEDTGKPLAGAEFSIKHNGNIIYEGVTDASGVINLSSLSAGWYEVTELAAPHGYLLVTEKKSVYLEAGGSAQLKFDNRRKPALTIEKRDAMTMQPLAGAKFRVWETEGGTVGEYTTGADGKVTIENLNDIVYSVEEIAAPDGYLLDTQHKDVKLEWGKVTTLVFTDRQKPGLTITKVDEQTGERLADARFRVQSLDQGGFYYEGVTDANGLIGLTDLPEGVYEITETAAPDGYIIANHPKQIQLIGDSVVNVTFNNRKKPVLKIIKLDEVTKEPLAGAKFKVWKAEGNTVSEYVTGADGTVTIPNLDEAVYSIDEIAAPEHYALNTQHKDILLEWGKTTTVVYTNLKLPTLTIIKYDELTNEPLAGASFKLRLAEGETWSEAQVTGADGKITWVDLEPGIYSVQEIDEPFGYFKDGDRKEILLAGGDNKQLEFFNRPRPALTITKRDAATGEPIANVKFKIQKTEGATIGEFLTDENGYIELSPATGCLLEEAVYTVTEIAPPNEYLLSDSPSKQVLLKWYEQTDLIFENLLKPTLIFIKKDGMSGRGISGATYKVEYESANGGITNLGGYVTKCGIIEIPYVLPGWYILTETSAAPGYSLPTNPTTRLHLAPGENSYTYQQTTEDLYADDRTNPSKGSRGTCGEWCGYLCSVLCAGNCGNPGDGAMASGGGNPFGNMTITNGKGESLGGGTGGSSHTDATAPTLTAGTVNRTGNYSATVSFTSSEAGKYYTAYTTSGGNQPTISTLGAGTACVAGLNTITVSLTTGAKDLYIKVKDAAGNVSDALKIVMPAYSAQTQTPDTPDFGNIVIKGGTVVYINPDFSQITILLATKKSKNRRTQE